MGGAHKTQQLGPSGMLPVSGGGRDESLCGLQIQSPPVAGLLAADSGSQPPPISSHPENGQALAQAWGCTSPILPSSLPACSLPVSVSSMDPP